MSVAKLFQGDTSLFSVVHDPKITSLSLNEDLLKINKWAYQWEMFNPDTSKQTQEVVFSRKKKKNSTHGTFLFNNLPVQ